MSFKEELNNYADEHNKETVENMIGLLREALIKQAKSGHYTYWVDVMERYIPRVIDALIKWEVIYKITGHYFRQGERFITLTIFWNHHDEQGKSIGFAGNDS